MKNTKPLRDGTDTPSANGVATASENEKAANFTPGPWRLLVDPPDKRKGERMALVATPNGRMAIDFTSSGATYEQDCANARLASASPDLLQALRFIANLEDLTFAECSVAEDIISTARAAIAKAEAK